MKNETPAQVFSCEFCKIARNSFFREHIRWLFLKKETTVRTSRIFLYSIWTGFSDITSADGNRDLGAGNMVS